MKKVLIISPHFPPINAPDMQRVRLVLPYLRANGWEATVLAVDPDSIEGGVLEPRLEATYPATVRVIRVRGISPRLTRLFGFGNLWLRCGRALARRGAQLLRAEHFDLIFFSTTQFDSFRLGPRWRRAFGVPFVIDYQDPWINTYYHRSGTRPPGGWVRYAFSQWTARRAEPRVLREAAGIIAVSPAYAATLAQSYSWFDPARVELLPFGASEADFTALEGYRPAQPLINFADGNFHHVHAGRCGPDMACALTILFRAFRRYLASDPAEAARMRFHFIGTDYAPPPLGRDWVLPLAAAEGVGQYVSEHRYRVPYFDALYYLREAQALLGIGSDDPTYSASKIFPYVLARRPMMLLFHQNSLVLAFADRAAAGRRFRFAGPADIESVAGEVHARWFVERQREEYLPFDENVFGPYSAAAGTAALAGVFDRAAAR